MMVIVGHQGHASFKTTLMSPYRNKGIPTASLNMTAGLSLAVKATNVTGTGSVTNHTTGVKDSLGSESPRFAPNRTAWATATVPVPTTPSQAGASCTAVHNLNLNLIMTGDLHIPASLTSQKKSSKKKNFLPLFLKRSALLQVSTRRC